MIQVTFDTGRPHGAMLGPKEVPHVARDPGDPTRRSPAPRERGLDPGPVVLGHQLCRGHPAADCWRAWCVDGWSYPAYPYRPAGWYRADPYSVPPYTPPAWLRQVSPLSSAPGCRPAPVLDQVLWGC